jgi:hypothetical protein
MAVNCWPFGCRTTKLNGCPGLALSALRMSSGRPTTVPSTLRMLSPGRTPWAYAGLSLKTPTTLPGSVLTWVR